MRGSKGESEPMIASSDMAPARIAAAKFCSARMSAKSASGIEPRVSPSFHESSPSRWASFRRHDMLPACYGWLAREPGPKMIVEALRLYGMLETPGSSNNPTIMAWAKEVAADVADVYKADSIPWLRTLHGGRREACRQGESRRIRSGR